MTRPSDRFRAASGFDQGRVFKQGDSRPSGFVRADRLALSGGIPVFIDATPTFGFLRLSAGLSAAYSVVAEPSVTFTVAYAA